MNRPDAHNPYQTNVTTGVILSAPLLLFPSSDSCPPTTQILKDATIAFASRLVQVAHQEAVLKSLMKIRDAVGEEEFEGYLADYDGNMKRNIEVLSKIYDIKPGGRKGGGRSRAEIVKERRPSVDKSQWESDSDTSGIAEDEGPPPGRAAVPDAEIKFNDKTAITMTILDEGKVVDGREAESDEATADEDPSAEMRKTPRRVRFGGEIVKLRTPDSDETESTVAGTSRTFKTRIPLPVSPATRMPEEEEEGARRRPRSQPSSPHATARGGGARRPSRSASSSPKREAHTHNAQLSPKKSILTRTTTEPLVIVDLTTEETRAGSARERRRGEGIGGSQESRETAVEEQRTASLQARSSRSNQERGRGAWDANDAAAATARSVQVATEETRATVAAAEGGAVDPNANDAVAAAPPAQSRWDRVATTGPIGSERSDGARDDGFGPETAAAPSREPKVSANDLAFGSPVNERDPRMDHRLVDVVFDVEDGSDISGLILADDRATRRPDVAVVESEVVPRGMPEANGSVTCSSSEGEGKPQEPNWEELGLVDQEVLDDLHNKVRERERESEGLVSRSA